MALGTGSPAIDAITTCAVRTDQRGYPRVGLCDIGAYEDGAVPDTTLPEVVIDAPIPSDPSNSADASFYFSGTDDFTLPEDLVFWCAVDTGDFELCTSPWTYTSLGEGFHSFSVYAVDEADNQSPEAEYSWAVDLTSPTATIDSGPDDPTNSTDATFEFSANDNATVAPDFVFQCDLDSNGWEDCSSDPGTKSYTGLSEGMHTFTLNAVDEAGNSLDPNFVDYTWEIDLTAPDAPLVTAPPAFTNDTTPTISGTAEAGSLVNVSYRNGASFDPLCQDVLVDGAGDWSCVSSVTLGEGEVELAVNATDVVGNTSTDTSYTFTVDATNVLVNVFINGGDPVGNYLIPTGESVRVTYDNVDNGPVKVVSTNGVPIIASMRINLKTLPSYASYSEFMGIPASKLTDTYLFPWYNNATTGGLSSQLRFGNVGSDPTLVTVTIGGVERGSYPLDPNESARVTFDNVDAGPVEVTSSGGVPIIASMRINLKTLPSYSSYSEFMGLSASATPGTSYLFPWYNNATTGGLSSQLRFGNVGTDPTLVTVTIGGVERGSYPLDPNESARVTFDNVDAGPVEVTSSGGVPIIASMRINLKTLPSYASYSEFMGLPGAMLTETRYLFPWYNNATTGGLSSQLRFGNVGTDPTLVTVTIGGEVQDTYPLDPNESLRVTYDNVDAGPVEVTSSGGVPIIASMRINLKSLPAYSSYSEFMGLSVGSSVGMPGNELSSTYWFPWYNNATTGGLSSQLRFGVP